VSTPEYKLELLIERMQRAKRSEQEIAAALDEATGVVRSRRKSRNPFAFLRHLRTNVTGCGLPNHLRRGNR
jgi:hypothetical protein